MNFLLNEKINIMNVDMTKEYEQYVLKFKNLFENKVIYHEKFSCIVKLENIRITKDRFEATAIPYIQIESGRIRLDSAYPRKAWEFGGTWETINSARNNLFSPYGGWSIWFDPELVKKIEILSLEKNYKEALSLMFGED